MNWTDNAMCVLVLNKYAEEEIRRLNEKARLMKIDEFNDQEKESDRIWRETNNKMLLSVQKKIKNDSWVNASEWK